MRHAESAGLAIVLTVAGSWASPAWAQQPEIVGHTVDMSSRQARLGLELSDGREVNITMARGVLRINGADAGRYPVGAALESGWRQLLDDAASLSTPEVRARLAAWNLTGLIEAETAVKRRIERAVRELPTAAAAATPEWADPVIAAPPRAPEPETRVDVRVDQIRERVGEQVAAQVEAAMEQARNARQFGGPVPPARRGVGDVGNNVAGLVGVFVALACIGFGLVSFVPRQLEAVSDTLNQSFLRAFLAGLFAQPLLLPALGMLIVGLVLTVVGILVLPFAVAAFAVAVVTGLVGGYVAAARSLGEIVLRRRSAQGGDTLGITPYRSILVGLAGLLAIWAPFALLSWVPGAAWILLACALFFTWIMATAGFGATILSRAGLRTTFVRPGIPSFAGERWDTGELAAARSAVKELE